MSRWLKVLPLALLAILSTCYNIEHLLDTTYVLTLFAPNETRSSDPAFVGPLTLLATQGVDFSDKLAPVKFDFNTETRVRLWESIGAEDLNSSECTSTGRLSVAIRMHSVGFGSRILNLANSIITVAFQRKYRLFFIPLLPFGGVRTHGKPYNVMQQMFERMFSFASNLTSCNVFETKCLGSPGMCYSGWVEPSTSTSSHYSIRRNMLRQLLSLRNQKHKLFISLKTVVVREIMRMHRYAKQQIDELLIEGPLYGFVPSQTFQVAMHIRRTDKLAREADFVHSRVFVQALKHVLDTYNMEKLPVVLHLLTDDCQVNLEFPAELLKFPDLRQLVETRFRCAVVRPDRLSSAGKLKSFEWLLVDLRLMVESNVFIGSQSSNMGVISCLMRAYDGCFSVESKFPFWWDDRKDKLT